MAARAYWKGYLRLSLVTIGVELVSAVSRSSSLALHQIHKPSGKRIRYQKVAPGIGPVDADEIVKGYEIDRDQYVTLEPEELEHIKLESKHTIDLVQFVEHCEIDPRFFDKPYYVLPNDNHVAQEGFSVIREALRSNKKVALGQMASRGRDYIVAIKSCGAGLLLETLRFADEIRAADTIFEQIPTIEIDDELLHLASELIQRKSEPFDAAVFKSQYFSALQELIEEKRKTGAVKGASDEKLGGRGDNVIDLMSALKKSVARDKKGTRSGGTQSAAKNKKRGSSKAAPGKKAAKGRSG